MDRDKLIALRNLVEEGYITQALNEAFTAGQECGYSKGFGVGVIQGREEFVFSKQGSKL
jgi:hypothetical protein